MSTVRKITLTEPQRVWLEALYTKLGKGEPASKRSLMIELRDRLPSKFDPSSIDSRLLRRDTNITLLGIAVVAPSSELVATADKVIRGVRELLSNNPDVDNIDADDIAHLTGVGWP